MSEEYFLSTSKQLISNFVAQHPKTAEEIQLIFKAYEEYYKKMYDLERRERMLEMETNMALRKENIDLRSEIEGLRAVVTQFVDNNNKKKNNINKPTASTNFVCGNNISINSSAVIVETIPKDKDIDDNVVTKKKSAASLDTSEKRRSNNSSVSEGSSRPRGTSIFGDLNDIFNDGQRATAPLNHDFFNEDHKPTIDAVLNSKNGSYFSLSPDNNNDDIINNFSDMYNVHQSTSKSNRLSPALNMNEKPIPKEMGQSGINTTAMLGYGPTKVESDLAKRLAKLSGHCDVTPNELALALARSVNIKE
jgi:hypothetical protein